MSKKFKNLYIFSGYFLLILSIFLIFSNTADAANWGVQDALINGFGWIIYAIVFTIGKFTSFLLGWLIQVASFNNFIDVGTVTKGWVIVRDLCNMFFILILLVVAFATILRIESYQWKKILPKLLIMAVLINFSKTICGLITDFSQVIMLTFVNGIGNGAANLTSLLGMDKMMAYNTSKKEANLGLETVAGIILALFSALVVLVVVVVMIAMLVMRVIMIWIYVILSPIAFLAAAFPAGQKYSSQWWSEFSKQVVSGPVLAFFLWLALVSAQESSATLGVTQITGMGLNDGILTQFLSASVFQTYIITLGLLIGGLMVTQQMGGIAASIAGKGLEWAKGAAKGVGKAVGYIPAQYAKKAGYGLGDMALGQLSKVPIIGNLAMEGKGRLRMHRDYAEEKDTKYMQYLEEQDLDRIIARQRSGGVIATLGRGMESKRQLFNRALVQKSKGDEWGMTKEEKMASKTRYLIELGQIAGHSVTSSGEDAFRDAEKGKLWHEFRNKHAGMIDDEQMRTYYLGGQGNAIGLNGARTGAHYNYRGLGENAANSEYWRGPDANGDPQSPNSMLIYTLSRQRMNEVHNLHHENFGPRHDAQGNLHYDALDAVYDEGNGSMKTLAQIRDRGTRQQKLAMRAWIAHRLAAEQAGGTASTYFSDIYADAGNPPQEEFLNEMMSNGGLQIPGGRRDRIGASRAIMGEIHSTEVASGITGLGRADRGVMAANFSELGLEKSAAKYFEGADKAEIASRIGGSLRGSGIAEATAKAVEEQINQASYLILHNKEAGVSSSEGKTAHAHELMHARVGANFSQGELKGVWNSMSENDRTSAKTQISAKWGSNMSEDAIMNEYFAEGLTAKTRWGKGAAVSLNQTAESGLDGLLKAKGSNINAFTSNVIKTRPTSNDISQSMANNVDNSLKDTLDELIGTLKDVGNGFSSIENFSNNLSGLQRSMERNRTGLENSTKGYKNVTDKLNNLSSKIS